MTGNTPFVTAPAQGKVNPGSHNNTFSLKIISIATSETPATVPLDKGKLGENDAQEKPQGPPIKAVLLTTLPLHAPNLGVFRSYVTLRFVRNRLMQSFPSATPFTFCNEEGAATQDDLSLNAYFALLKRQPTLQDTTFNVYVTSSGPPATQASTYFAALLKKPFLLKFLRVIDSQRSNIETSLDSGAFKGKNAADTTLHTLRGVVKSMSVDSRQDIFCLPDGTPVQDNVSLLQYLVMVNPTISGAEKIPSVPVFLKKTGLLAIQSTQGVTSGSPGFIPGSGRPYGDPNSGAPGQWATGIDQSVISKLGSLDMSFTDRSAQELHRDKTDLQATEMLHEKDHAGAAGALPNIHKLSETEWDMILKNGNAFCGWIIDFDGNKIRRAPHAAFRLRKGLNLEKVNVKVEKVSTPTPSATDKKQDQEHSESGSDDKDPKSKAKEDSAAPTTDEMKEYMPRKAHGIPNFMVNDDSSIEVAAVRHAFSQSMAENHFDKTTFDFEASGGFRGITAGAQGGIPRVTVYLPAEDLEVTDEFAAAVEKIRKTRNLYDLRKLHQMFGQVFCSEIVLGGCLQTSKTLDAKEQEKESMARSEFKASVGLAVGFRQIASGSVKASHENQSHQEQGNKDTKQVEHLSFNATGGNTILAADPPAWLTSVGSVVNSWRVIQQSQLTAVMDVVSAIPHYEEVNKWFLQAVPKLTDYVIIPQNRTVNARFKVMFTLEGLSRALAGLKVGKDGQESKNEDVGISKGSDSGAIQTYLAHQPEKPPIYVRTFVKKYDEKPMIVPSPPRWEGGRMKVDATAEIYQTTKTTTHAIFQPPSTQAPVLINPRALKPLPPKADSKGKPSPATIDGRTVWAIEVPEGYSLTHESLVTIKSQASSTPGTSLTLSVYRNSQGVFMPAITNQPDPVYWRVLKVNAKTGGKDANQLKYGDPIRLCWRFSDQTSGWRDYVDDYYGRRRFDHPAELGKNEGALYLKAPFPRFEALDDPQGMSLVLSSAATKDPILTKLKLREPSAPGGSEQVAYNLFDLTFRLDFVPANGQVEAYEYMDMVREDDTYASLTELRTKYKVISHVTNTFVKQFENIVNAVRHGSPGDVLKETFKGAMMVNPVGFLTKLAGFW
ncbi:Hypothetical protein NCS54_01307100 [Fusarium falciforme]|uniref:Hypothetical protein n=1 Tax=Fusarium falciforme TaxID=195108 RepID=UPI00230079A7|nr:Hypothetical protein NCS54_01307100 [Fusarium falciforme]WAO95448.1 Hypothetical protein NCS54_01307100 [Fusarium falciforme]